MSEHSNHVEEEVDAYVHDVLAAADRERVERHIADCPACWKLLAEARQRLDALRSLPGETASEELIRRTERRLHRAQQTALWRIRRIAAAAAVLVIAVTGLMHWHYRTMAPSPYDLCVLGQTQLLPGAESSLRVIVTNHESRSALSGVPVEITLTSKQANETVTLEAGLLSAMFERMLSLSDEIRGFQRNLERENIRARKHP